MYLFQVPRRVEKIDEMMRKRPRDEDKKEERLADLRHEARIIFHALFGEMIRTGHSMPEMDVGICTFARITRVMQRSNMTSPQGVRLMKRQLSMLQGIKKGETPRERLDIIKNVKDRYKEENIDPAPTALRKTLP